jgi:hypothetical protein
MMAGAKFQEKITKKAHALSNLNENFFDFFDFAVKKFFDFAVIKFCGSSLAAVRSWEVGVEALQI